MNSQDAAQQPMNSRDAAQQPSTPGVPPSEMTVGQAASLLGVTVRTLHHWDEIGLVKPSERSSAGYRVYTAADVSRMHRVLIYRELDIPLDDISRLLEAGSDDLLRSLGEQKDRIAERIRRLQQMSSALEELIAAQESGILLSPEEQVAIFGKNWNPEWSEQARQRWGDSTQWTQYAERASRRNASDWKELTTRTKELEADLVAAFHNGLAPGTEAADALAERHRSVLTQYFECSHSMQVCIARMYLPGEDFHPHYEGLAPGLAAWLKSIIDANARHMGIDPETAAWE